MASRGHPHDKLDLGVRLPCKWRDNEYRACQTMLNPNSTLTCPDQAEIIEKRIGDNGEQQYYVHYCECTRLLSG